MRSPVAALLWESWRLTRVEMAFRMALALIAGAAPLVLARAAAGFSDGTPADIARLVDTGAVAAMFALAVVALPFWFSIALLNGGRLIDGGKPGFPFSIGFTRPVATALLVGVPLTYFAVANAALYLVPALTLGGGFGYAFPLAPFAAWLVALSLVQAATSWWTRSKTVQLTGGMVASTACVLLALRQIDRVDLPGANLLPVYWPAQFALSPADYGVIGAIATASLALAIAGVARQRHGDTLVQATRSGRPVSPGWRVEVFRLPCPTRTPTRAQWWIETMRTGRPLLTVGLVSAAAVPLVLAAAGAWAPSRLGALMLVTFAPVVVLRMGVDNVFGLRRKAGHTYASTFDASQPIGTAQLVSIKVLARAGYLVLAMVAIGVSAWWSVPLLEGWPLLKPWGDYHSLVSGQRAAAAAIEVLTGGQRLALAILIAGGVFTTVAHVASLQALRLFYRNSVHAGLLLMVVYTVIFVAESKGWIANGLAIAIAETYPWMMATVIGGSTLLVFRVALRERLLTPWHAVAAVLFSTACLMSWLTLTPGGFAIGAMPFASLAMMLSVSLLPATAVAVTPRAYSLIRHR